MTTGEKIAFLRKKIGITQEQMAEMFPSLKQKYIGEEEVFFVILKLGVDAIEMD